MSEEVLVTTENGVMTITMNRPEAKNAMNKNMSELIAADLRDSIDYIGQVVGKVDNEQMLDRLFKQFCIGK